MANEPTNYRNNVHFWLRKIYYYVANVPDGTQVSVISEESTPGKTPPEKGDLDIRNELKGELRGLNPNIITKEEAQEACAELYAMFNMPLDSDVLDFIEDPRCPGGRPRSKY